MRPVIAFIFHAPAPQDAGPLTRALVDARHALAEVQRAGFIEAGADRVEVIEGTTEAQSFGARLREAVRSFEPRGAVVLGSGSIPLAISADLRRFVEIAAGPPGHALANNRFSADVVAVSAAGDLAELPPLPADNALPRWLEERAGVTVTDLRDRWQLGVDLDSPADLALLASAEWLPQALRERARSIATLAPEMTRRVGAVCGVLRNRRGELFIAGRISGRTLAVLETETACRIRALVEERGLRASTRLAQADDAATGRPPRSILGHILDREGPAALSSIAGDLGDAAVIDTRVLLAHRLGADEAGWPSPEDRFASDMLQPASIGDAWLRELTESTLAAPIPILLGGHSLVSGGLRILASR